MSSIEGRQPSLFSPQPSAPAWSVGETVQFPYRGGVVAGRIETCNPKTVTVIANGASWRVPYRILRKRTSVEGAVHRDSLIRTDESRSLHRPSQRSLWSVGQAVGFRHRRGTVHGRIKSLNRRTVTVVTCNDEWRVSYFGLRQAAEESVPPLEQCLRSIAQDSADAAPVPLTSAEVAANRTAVFRAEQEGAWAVGDVVDFRIKGRTHAGQIRECNPRRALVEADGGGRYFVPYRLLRPRDMLTGIAVADRRRRLAEVSAQAARLIAEHELVGWRFEWDAAQRRGGLCRYDRRTISLSTRFVLAIDDYETTDTILHEIAHALIGPGHGHNRKWKAMAKKIGCSAKVTHDVEFSQARWVGACEACDEKYFRLRRPERRGALCGVCRAKIRWRRVRGRK